ncbi:MAG: VWA domain-containing protein [Bryobacterales bacterium]|nr:VWA domain-containing protein [Bryobacterales bacterium]
MHPSLRTFLAAMAACFPLAAAPADDAGSLRVIDREGHIGAHCPLRRTEVKASISGFLTRVTVTQHFENPLAERIEAVYTFPLPQSAAVDDMTMLVGERTIKGKIKPREEAKAIYEAARQAGRTASLLEQERANIFTQSVANIRPGEKVKITISYVETLRYEAGSYEFVFPMVVGPRYIPKRLTDATRITPPVTPEGTRAGHDITLEVALDAGVPIEVLRSPSHEVLTERMDGRRAAVKLKNQATIPNKDFVLQYDVAGRKIEDAVLTHRGAKGGFFSLILQPPDRVAEAEVTPKELVFVLDTSGSMSGFPMEKSKEVMRMALTSMHARDTFNIITFAGDTHVLFPQPVAATAENVAAARNFLEGRRGGGGTEMMKAIRAALAPTASQEHVRVVAFLTDGYVGNDLDVIAEVKKYPNARVFSFGIGNAVNRFLLDKMAEHGRGEVEYVTLNADGSAAAKRFYERMRTPLLTDIRMEWNGLPVTEVYPKRIPDLFAAKPVVIHGRFTAAAKGVVKLYGKSAGREVVRTVQVDLPAQQGSHDVLAPVWARTKIEDLTSMDYAGVQRGTVALELRNEITKLGLDFRLMTQFTAFVAVEEKMVSEGGAPRRIEVPVEMPEGVSYQGVFGERLAGSGPAPVAMRSRVAATAGFAGGNVWARKDAEAQVAGGPAALPAPLPAPKEERDVASRQAEPRKSALEKLHPTLAAMLPVQPKSVLKVKVYLTGDGTATVQKLAALGVTVVRHDTAGGFLVVRTAVENLLAVVKVNGVRYVSPVE